MLTSGTSTDQPAGSEPATTGHSTLLPGLLVDTRADGQSNATASGRIDWTPEMMVAIGGSTGGWPHRRISEPPGIFDMLVFGSRAAGAADTGSRGPQPAADATAVTRTAATAVARSDLLVISTTGDFGIILLVSRRGVGPASDDGYAATFGAPAMPAAVVAVDGDRHSNNVLRARIRCAAALLPAEPTAPVADGGQLVALKGRLRGVESI